jgi:hypothetical protein
MLAAPVETGNPFIDGMADAERDRDTAAVMLGCIAARGYKLVGG